MTWRVSRAGERSIHVKLTDKSAIVQGPSRHFRRRCIVSLDFQVYRGDMQGSSSNSAGTILIVDDDVLVRRTLQTMLEHGGHLCRSAVDGAEGLEMLRAADCDVALIDMHMPRLDGLGLLAGMRQQHIQAVPLVLTGFGEIASAVEAMKLGAFDYLTKPPDYQELTRATTRAIEHSRARRHGRIMEDLAAQWEMTFDACPDLMAILDSQQCFLRCNQALAHRLGVGKIELVGQPFLRIIGDSPEQQALLARTLADGAPQTLEILSDRLQGAFILTLAPLRSNSGPVFGAVFVARDVTERKHAEQARAQLLAREQAARLETAKLLQETQKRERELRALASELSSTEDRERRKLALSIHDSLSQTLSVVKLKLMALCHNAEGQVPVARDLADLLQLVDQLIQQTRSLTFDLYPAMLDDLGLVPTLKWFGTRYFEQTGIKVEVAEFGHPVTLPTPVVTYLFRAVKELLHNVAKHAHAKEVVLSVYWQRQRMRIVLVDDGCGVDKSPKDNGSATSTGLGLVGIRERIHSFGGEFVFESWPGRGTQVTLEVPLESQ
jgi:PAS domain S-box-containing protein